MLINLSKFLMITQAIDACPVGVPKRNEKIYAQFKSFTPTSDHVISIEVAAHLDDFLDTNIDEKNEDQRKKIVFDLIQAYSLNSLRFPKDSTDVHLISPLTKCDLCDVGELSVVRPDRVGRTCLIYSEHGARECTVYHKFCRICGAKIYPCYSEKVLPDKKVTRKYLRLNQVAHFGVTNETYFTKKFLENVTEDVFTCHARINNIVLKYNRLNSNSVELNKKRLQSAWIIFSIVKRMEEVSFPVFRDTDGGIDIDAVCGYLYPQLKKKIDSKWIKHYCENCKTRVVVMDGACKVYRTVCSARGEKITNAGKLNEFTACSRSPLPGHNFCQIHMNDKPGEVADQLDASRMTRQRRKELGLDIDELSSNAGCRRKENINVRTKRSKTAGMLYCYRPCGISLGHVEMIHAERNAFNINYLF